jgi:RND family efflux transporter MFP subunit
VTVIRLRSFFQVGKAGIMGLLLAGNVAPVNAESFDCLIEPFKAVDIRSPVEGLIEAIHVRRGDRVEKGSLLVELESRRERSTVELARYRAGMEGRLKSAENRLVFATKKLDRVMDLHEQSFLSGQVRDEVETERLLAESELMDVKENRKLAQLEYERSKVILDLRSLYSPFDGVVVDRLLNPGELAESGIGGAPILELAQINPLLVKVSLPARMYGQVKVGKLGFVTPEVSGQPLEAEVTIVDSVFDAASGTFGIRLELPNPEGQVPAGIRCRLELADGEGENPAL